MLPLIIPTICLSLAAGALAEKTEIYMREGGSHPDTPRPNVTVSAHSRIACSFKCMALEKWRCSGFWYQANGICVLYTCLNTNGTSPPEENTTPEQPVIYQRLGCPGNASDPCGCPDGFTRCAGRCLRHLDQYVTYSKAEEACTAIGAHPAVPRSEEESKCAVAMSAFPPSPWLGYRGGRTKESFVGADGCGAITYADWYTPTNEPHLDSVDNCLILYDGYWADFPCSASLHSLCQAANCYRPECDNQ